MGYGLPAAIAASLVAPDRPVIALVGDGGFAMTMNELETAVRTGAHPVVLAFDNRRYGTIAMHQRNEKPGSKRRPSWATRLRRDRSCRRAQGGRVARDAEFEPALRDALAANRTVAAPPGTRPALGDARPVTVDEARYGSSRLLAPWQLSTLH